MTNFERPTCHICNEKIDRHEGHLGYPFVETPRHFKCSAKCEKCGLKVYDIPEHMRKCEAINK